MWNFLFLRVPFYSVYHVDDMRMTRDDDHDNHDDNYDEDDLGCPFVYGRMKE